MDAPAIGLLLPASNRVMEQDFIRWSIPDDLRLHVNRLNAPRVRPNDMLENLAALTEGVPEAARLLGLARPDVIAFGCTSGSFLRGVDWEAQVQCRIREAAQVDRTVSTASAATNAFRALGATRIAIASPYPEAVNRLMASYLTKQGFQVCSLEAIDGWASGNIANLAPDDALRLVRRSLVAGVQACFISCTNFRAAELIDELEDDTGLPVVTANQATYWNCRRALGLNRPHEALGRLGAIAGAWESSPDCVIG